MQAIHVSRINRLDNLTDYFVLFLALSVFLCCRRISARMRVAIKEYLERYGRYTVQEKHRVSKKGPRGAKRGARVQKKGLSTDILKTNNKYTMIKQISNDKIKINRSQRG